jgi:hypothetical protein
VLLSRLTKKRLQSNLMPTEDDVWRDLRGGLPPGHYTRIESPISPGVPDVNFCVNGPVEGWVELKYTERLPLEHPVLPTQKIWIRQHLERGGHVLIAVAIKRELFIVAGSEAPYVNDWNYNDFECVSIARAANRRKASDVLAAFNKAFYWLIA